MISNMQWFWIPISLNFYLLWSLIWPFLDFFWPKIPISQIRKTFRFDYFGRFQTILTVLGCCWIFSREKTIQLQRHSFIICKLLLSLISIILVDFQHPFSPLAIYLFWLKIWSGRSDIQTIPWMLLTYFLNRREPYKHSLYTIIILLTWNVQNTANRITFRLVSSNCLSRPILAIRYKR